MCVILVLTIIVIKKVKRNIYFIKTHVHHNIIHKKRRVREGDIDKHDDEKTQINFI